MSSDLAVGRFCPQPVTLRLGRMAATVAFVCLVGQNSTAGDAAPNPALGPGTTTPTPAELRARFTGFYRYVGSPQEQEARAEAIRKSVAPFFFAIRGVARRRIEARTRIVATCKFEFTAGNIRSTVPGFPIAISPESGAPVDLRVDDETVSSRRSVRPPVAPRRASGRAVGDTARHSSQIGGYVACGLSVRKAFGSAFFSHCPSLMGSLDAENHSYPGATSSDEGTASMVCAGWEFGRCSEGC